MAQQSTGAKPLRRLHSAKNTNRSGRPRTQNHPPLACIKSRTCKSYFVFTHAASPLAKAKAKGGEGGGAFTASDPRVVGRYAMQSNDMETPAHGGTMQHRKVWAEGSWGE